MKPINKASKIGLPIKPTEKPQPQDMAAVALAIINTTQKSILSPAAVMATLKCAYDLYRTNAVALGFHEEAAVECDKLGAQLAEAMRRSGAIKTQSPIAVPDTTLVAPNGQPLHHTLAGAVARIREQASSEPTYDTQPEKCQNADCGSTSLTTGSVNSRPGWVCTECRGFHFQAQAVEAGAETSGA